MSSLPPVFVELKANVGEFKTAMGEARTEIDHLKTRGQSGFTQFAAFGKAALFGLGTAAVGLGGMALKMADDFEKSHAKLQQAIKDSGNSFEAFSPQIDASQKKMEALGFTSAQTQEALANLTTGLGSPAKALKDMGLAADVARFKHIDLATAATLVTKAEEGNLKALKQMGIDLPIAGGGAKALAQAQQNLSTELAKTKTFLAAHPNALSNVSKYHLVYMQMLDKVHASQVKVNAAQVSGKEIITALTQKVGGQATAVTETFSGKVEVLKIKVENLGSSLGLALIPKIEALVTGLTKTWDWFKRNKTVAETLAIAIGTTLTVAIGAYVVNMARAAAATVIAFGPWSIMIAAVLADLYLIKEIYDYLTKKPQSSLPTGAPTWKTVGGKQVLDHAPSAAYIQTHPNWNSQGLAGVRDTSGYRGLTTPNITINIAGSLVAESQITNSIQTAMAQALKRQGKKPSTVR